MFYLIKKAGRVFPIQLVIYVIKPLNKMYKLTLLILLATQFLVAQKSDSPLNVLFVGNSLTYFNTMPQQFEQIADEQGHHVTVDQHTPGGTGFVHHVANNTLYQKFRDKVWDYVILQPGSNESPGFSYPIAETITRAKRLRDSIVKYSPCASIHYYEISYGIVNNTPASFTQYQDRQTLIKNNLTQMATETGIPFVPVGECFKASMETDDSQFLWVNYGDIHPNAKGSYLAACSFFNGIFKNPIVNTAQLGGLSNADALFLRNQAENTTLNSLDSSLINTYTSTANFDFTATATTSVSFTNTSTNYDTVHWDFGDGTTSTSENINHNFDFSTNPSYTVLMTAYKDCKEHHKIITITEDLLATEEYLIEDNVTLFPNPTSDLLHINTGKTFTVNELALYDVLGKQVSKKHYTILNNGRTISLKSLSVGVYIISVTINSKKQQFKVIKT